MYAWFRLIESISIDETKQHAEPSRSASEQRPSLSLSLIHSNTDSRSLFLSYKINLLGWEAKSKIITLHTVDRTS